MSPCYETWVGALPCPSWSDGAHQCHLLGAHFEHECPCGARMLEHPGESTSTSDAAA